MITKSVLFYFAQVIFVQCISAQCINTAYDILGVTWTGSPYSAPRGAPVAAPYIAAESGAGFIPSASKGGAFTVTSVSRIAPTGIFVSSENAYSGPVVVSGRLPFLSAVALEGPLPTAGSGTISFGGGNGNTAILSEDILPNSYTPVTSIGVGTPVAEGFSYNGLGGYGYSGCGY